MQEDYKTCNILLQKEPVLTIAVNKKLLLWPVGASQIERLSVCLFHQIGEYKWVPAVNSGAVLPATNAVTQTQY